MREIKFDTGLVSYNLGGKVQVKFNPTDVFFLERIYGVFESLDEKQDEYDAARKSIKTPKEMFDTAHKLNTEMIDMINDLFGAACDDVFNGIYVHAYSGGLPLWCNLLFATVEEMDAKMVQEQTKTNPRIAKYTEKYKKYKK